MTLHGGRAVVTGRRSGESLYDFDLATYDTGDTFDQSLAKGFIDLWGLPSKIAAKRDRAQGRTASDAADARAAAAVGRPVRRRAGRRAGGAVACRSTSTGGWRRTTSPARARTPASCTGPGCSTTTSSAAMLAGARRARRPTSRAARSCRHAGRRGRAHRARARADRAARRRSAASCAPAGPATTRSPPTSGCTCATHARQLVPAIADLQEALLDQAERARRRPGARASRTCSTRSRCRSRTSWPSTSRRWPATSTGCATGTRARRVLAARRRRARRLVAAARPAGRRRRARLRRRGRELHRRGVRPRLRRRVPVRRAR